MNNKVTPAKADILTISGLTKHFGGLPALSGVSFAIAPGQVTALIGPNGAGKTTLINCLTGVIRPDWGTVLFQGMDIAGLPAHRLAHLGISRTFQNLGLFPRLTVLDNVLCGLTVQANHSFWQAMLRPPRVIHQERKLKLLALQVLDLVQLTNRAEQPAGVLPYGEKKRLELARAFVANPRLALLDEPVAGLNLDETAQIAGLIRQLRQAGKTILLVEHDMDMVMSISDHVVVLDSGRVIAQGTPRNIQRNPLVLEAYLGRASSTA